MYKRQLFLGVVLFTMAVGSALAFNPQRSRALIEEAVRLTEHHQFRMAYYKFRTVRLDALDLRHSVAKTKLIHAIDTSIEKLNDPYLSGYQKISIVKDCARVAYLQIQQVGGPGPIPFPGGIVSVRETLPLMNQVKIAVRQYREHRAKQLLRTIIRSVSSQGFNQDLQKASEAARTVLEKLNDPYLSAAEKERVAADCAKVFRQAVNRYLNFSQPPFYPRPPIIGGPVGPCPF